MKDDVLPKLEQMPTPNVRYRPSDQLLHLLDDL